MSCQRKSAKKGAPDAATPSLNFCCREGKGKTNHLAPDSLPRPALPLACALRRFGHSCPRWRLEFLLRGGKREGAV
ncbi:hypothetical protein CJO78_05660 [Ralstonia solanacearum]|nr:hypothetical protein CJO78_05660 [Ralstonia solanacearum]AXW05336.1 hypothetical protein CJO82_05435 [Ralstonia solanacearum]AXW23077.1 hypothetical protein CJO86_05440 [Ralstonia solanacearum]